MKIDTSEQKIVEIMERGVSEIIHKDSLKKKLVSGKELRIKFGIDPTSPNLHIGRAVPLLKLKDLQDMGHKIIFLVGNATGVIGDTSDKEAERPMLTEALVKENMAAYAEQAGKILDMAQVEVVYNADWLNDLGYKEIGEHADSFSLHDFIARENIKKRLDAGKRVSLREVLYPLMQGYDSVELRADVELGGSDQRFNLLAGRVLQEKFGQEPQDVLMMNLILGTDGRKMSSSWGNTINISDEPKDMYGKVMSAPDELMESYFIHCTRVPMSEVRELLASENPRDTKMRLALEIVKIYHGEDTARAAEKYFVETFQKGGVPEDVEEYQVHKKETIVDVLVNSKSTSSKTDARRLVDNGAVSYAENGEKITDKDFKITKPATLKIGKKRFLKIKV